MSEERRWVSRWLLDRARSPWRSPGPKIQVLSCLLSHSLDENVERTAARCGARIAGTNLSPEGRPPSPRSSPQWGRGCTPVAWRCWPAQGHWRRSNPVRSRSRARARPWPKCPTCHSRHVAFVRAPHRLNGHGPCFYLGAGLVYVRHVWRTQYSGSHRFPSGTPFLIPGPSRRAHFQSGGGLFCLWGPKGVDGGRRETPTVEETLPIEFDGHGLLGILHLLDPFLNQQGLFNPNPARPTPLVDPSPGLSPAGRGENILNQEDDIPA
jgi:hypothetical protein